MDSRRNHGRATHRESCQSAADLSRTGWQGNTTYSESGDKDMDGLDLDFCHLQSGGYVKSYEIPGPCRFAIALELLNIEQWPGLE